MSLVVMVGRSEGVRVEIGPAREGSAAGQLMGQSLSAVIPMLPGESFSLTPDSRRRSAAWPLTTDRRAWRWDTTSVPPPQSTTTVRQNSQWDIETGIKSPEMLPFLYRSNTIIFFFFYIDSSPTWWFISLFCVHLRVAILLPEFCSRSARHFFGDTTFLLPCARQWWRCWTQTKCELPEKKK